MRTVKPDWILADLSFDCPEAPTAILQRSLMRAAREFSTTCLIETWVDIPVQSNVRDYPFERYLPEGWDVQYINEVEYNGCCIPCVDDSCKSHCQSGYILNDMTHLSVTEGYCPDSSDPECPDTLRVHVSLRPKADACELPVDMIDRFDEELKAGALSFLMAMKDKPWSDGARADYYKNEFEGGIASAKCLIRDKFRPGTSRIKPARVI